MSTDRLVDALWPRSPPDEGVKALQVAVSRLRRALGADGTLITRAPGYELRVEPDGLDADRYERAVAAGRGELARGDVAAASRTLHAALAMWRGPPLADLAFHDACRGEIARLEELRLAGVEEALEADLRLGRHAALVGDIERLVAEHPVRERLRGQLMLALYRSGRQAEALDAYRAARSALVDELGVEPGRELQELHQQILEQDATLDLPAAAPEPVPPDRFVGRDDELARLDATLAGAFAGRGGVVLVRGEPGIGKSGLLRVFRARARDRGAVVLSGRCWEAGGAPAFWPWIDALRAYVATCDPAEIAADADGQRRAQRHPARAAGACPGHPRAAACRGRRDALPALRGRRPAAAARGRDRAGRADPRRPARRRRPLHPPAAVPRARARERPGRPRRGVPQRRGRPRRGARRVDRRAGARTRRVVLELDGLGERDVGRLWPP